MGDGYPIQTNFTTGEVSPLMRGRVDISKYFNGCDRLENFIVHSQGGISRRMGTRFIQSTKIPSKFSLLLKFQFSTQQSYVLEFGESYIRFYKNNSVLVNAGVPVEVITTYLASELRDIYITQSADVLYIAHPNHKTAKLSRVSETNWTLQDISFQDGPYLDVDQRNLTLQLSNVLNRATIKSSAVDFAPGDVTKIIEYPLNGSRVVGVIKTFVSVSEVQIEPKDNIVDASKLDARAILDYAVAGGAAPNRIRSSYLIFSSVSENSYIKVGGVWYFTGAHSPGAESVTPAYGAAYSADVIAVASTPTLVATTGNLVFSNQSITADVTASGAIFSASTDVGRMLRMDFQGEIVWGTITSVADTMHASLSLGRMIPLAPKDPTKFIAEGITLKWRFGSWYIGNYPSVCVFHEQRLILAGSIYQSQTIWGSKAGDYENMAPTDFQGKVTDDSALNYTIASSEINAIKWMLSGPTMLIGTTGGEWLAKPSQLAEAITPTNIEIKPQTTLGSVSYVRPQAIGSAIIFAQRSGKKIRELTYDFTLDKYVGKDLTIISEHILRTAGKPVQVAYQQDPNPIYWVVTDLGNLVGMTYERDQEVVAWHRHTISSGFVESITVIPSSDGTSDVVYLIVRRTINGNTVRYVEFIENEFWANGASDNQNMFFLDAGLTYSGIPASIINGMNHLEGQVVDILADGSVRISAIVSGGSVPISGNPASIIHIGLGFSSLMKTLSLESGSDSGTAQGKIKRIHKLKLRLLDTIGFKEGINESNLQTISFRTSGGTMDKPPALFSGDKDIPFEGNYELIANYFIKQDSPYPLTLLSLMPQLKTAI